MALARILLLLSPVQSLGKSPFWGCGLLGDLDPSDSVWKGLISDLAQTSDFKKVATWNWDVSPKKEAKLTSDFIFFPNAQCAGTSQGGGAGYLDQNTKFSSGANMATLAVGGNEPDQNGFCQNYTHKDHDTCDGVTYRDGNCTGKAECTCVYKGGKCIYDVSGCGMWPVGSSDANCTGDPFPWWCFGHGKKECSPGQDPHECCSKPCQTGMVIAFSQFFVEMAYKGYTHATTPIVASDLSFTEQLLVEAGCDDPVVKALQGKERLRRGCPTHSAFHFYTMGCPTDPEASVQGFVDHVKVSKAMNAKFALEGTIVNELGSLKNHDTSCTDEQIAAMMGKMFEHLQTSDGAGVVSQMMWFNENQTGGTFDLRLVKDGKLSKLGEAYKTACQTWAQHHGVGSLDEDVVV